MKKLLLTLLVTLAGVQSMTPSSASSAAAAGGGGSTTTFSYNKLANDIFNSYQTPSLKDSLQKGGWKYAQTLANLKNVFLTQAQSETLYNELAKSPGIGLPPIGGNKLGGGTPAPTAPAPTAPAPTAPAQPTDWLNVAANTAYYTPAVAIGLMGTSGALRKVYDFFAGTNSYQDSYFSNMSRNKVAMILGAYALYSSRSIWPWMRDTCSSVATNTYNLGETCVKKTVEGLQSTQKAVTDFCSDPVKSAKNAGKAISKPGMGAAIITAATVATLGVNHKLYGSNSFWSMIRSGNILGIPGAAFKQACTTGKFTLSLFDNLIKWLFLSSTAPVAAAAPAVASAAPAVAVAPTQSIHNPFANMINNYD